MTKLTIPNVIESVTLLDHSTVELKYKSAVNVKQEDMREILDYLYAFTNNQRLKRLIIISKDSSMDIKARLLLQQENKDRKDTIIAEAVIVNTLAQKMSTNFYLKFIKDDYPSRFFTDYTKAIDWLNNH